MSYLLQSSGTSATGAPACSCLYKENILSPTANTVLKFLGFSTGHTTGPHTLVTCWAGPSHPPPLSPHRSYPGSPPRDARSNLSSFLLRPANSWRIACTSGFCTASSESSLAMETHSGASSSSLIQ